MRTSVLLLGFIALLALTAAGCASSMTPTAVSAPPPPKVTLNGQVQTVDPSTRIVFFTQPVQSFPSVTTTNTTTYITGDGRAASFADVKPGTAIQVTGGVGGTGTVVAENIRIFSSPAGAPALTAETITQVEETTKNFLSALSLDPSGKLSIKYLTTRFQGEIGQGTPVPQALGIQKLYPSFNLAPVQMGPNADTATIRVTLNYETYIDRIFTFVRQGGVWRIDRITPG